MADLDKGFPALIDDLLAGAEHAKFSVGERIDSKGEITTSQITTIYQKKAVGYQDSRRDANNPALHHRSSDA